MTVPVEGSAEVHLEELLKGVAFLALEGDPLIGTSIRMVTCDSREVTAGSLFVAIKGYCTDGGRFISSAVERGAAAVICEEFPPDIASSCLYIQVSDARKALAEAARIFYGKASDRLLIIGVTGTNGKTTTAKLITAMLNANGISAGYIGTNLCRIGELDIPLDRTTPEAPGLHALFSQMVEAGCRAAVMEVSSHALVLQRVFGIRFHAALFTNLTLEHLDFHGSMQEYAAAKQQLFDQLSPEGFAVFNGDDPWAEGMAARVAHDKICCCTLQRESRSLLACSRFFEADILESTLASSTVDLHFPDALIKMQVGLPGVFNVMNVLEAAAIGIGMGLAPEEICRSLSAVSSVEGRMERVGDNSGQGRCVFVDYAHTPDALFKALDTLRQLKSDGSRLIVVFGCGGNRDRSKRPEMGRIASELADEVIITSDNPRYEEPDVILDEIEQGITSSHYKRISDRAEAIRVAILMLREGDVLLVAGKGHEKYQEIAGRKEFFSDQEFIIKYMQENASPISGKGECVQVNACGVLTIDDFRIIGEVVVGARHGVPLPPGEIVSPVVVIDSREVRGEELFIALKGENADGHDFIGTVFEKGANWAMVSRQWHEAQGSAEPPPGKGLIVTDDTVTGLQQLATIYRSKFSIPVVAIGGSNGKTTTKEMMASVLGTGFVVHMSQGNRNNHLGVPLTLLQLRADTQIAVVEMGINHPGEMELLAGIVKPTHALLTNIGHEHLEFLLDLDGVAAAETQLFDYMRKNGGTAFVNTDDPWLSAAGAGLSGSVSYGVTKIAAHTCWAENISVNRDGMISFLLCSAAGNEAITLNFTGKHNVINALAAAALGQHFGLSLGHIRDGLGRLAPAPGWKRLEVVDSCGIRILNDTYNANSDSMRRAIDALCDIPCTGKRFAVLGDMLELGVAGDVEHEAIGRYIQQSSIDMLFTFGERSRIIGREAPDVFCGHFESREKLLAALLAVLQDGDILLFKGSRGMKLEQVVDALINARTITGKE